MCVTGVFEMYICGMFGGKTPIISETGATLSDVPIQISKSQFRASPVSGDPGGPSNE
jgi:hypothetical protein